MAAIQRAPTTTPIMRLFLSFQLDEILSSLLREGIWSLIADLARVTQPAGSRELRGRSRECFSQHGAGDQPIVRHFQREKEDKKAILGGNMAKLLKMS
jgi:hypothetical protein